MTDNPFRKALEGWTEDQWIKGDATRTVGARITGMCLIGRISVMCPGQIAKADPILRPLVKEQFPGRAHGPVDFNDHPDTTFEDVCQVLEKAAVRWDEQI